MVDIWMDVDAAVTVPVNILPLISLSDFKTVLDAETYDEAGLELIWNFVTVAGVQTHVAVTPTDTGGNYDWVNVGHGLYNIEIPASGGASANNDTEGFGWFSGKATDALPWRGPIIGFRRAALNDLMIEGGTASTNLEDFFDGTGYVGGAIKLASDATLNATQGSYAPAKAGDAMTLTAAGILAIWDQLLTGIAAAGSIGKLIKDYLDAAISTRSTYAGGAVASVTAGVTVATNNDKTGYSLSVTPPTASQIDTQLSGTHGAGAWGAGATGSSTYTDTITDDDGDPLEDVQVEVYSDSDYTTLVAVEETDVNGVFTFSLNSGTYYVRCIKSGYTFTDFSKVVT